MTFTVKELKQIIKGLPDDTEVLYERIEDVYFDEHKWKADYLYENPMHPSHPNTEYVEKDEYISPFNIFYVRKDKKLLITAHY